MRRSRIKVMASVPARRKPTKDLKDEKPDLSNIPIIIDIVDAKETKEIDVSLNEDAKENLVEMPNLLTVKDENEIELQQPPSPPQIVDIVEPDRNEEPATSCEPREDVIQERDSNLREEIVLEKTEDIIAKSPSRDKIIPEIDNSTGFGETKGSSVHETAPITKITQTRTSFMRPTPRLDGGGRIRRNSVQGSGASASESEDDSRRVTSVITTNRVRNDSVNSMNAPKTQQMRENSITSVSTDTPSSTAGGNVGSGGAISLKTTISSVLPKEKRKMKVSESARKLAEARREFLLKYEDKQPDRAKLTMYDLIYYNPVTNTLKKPDETLTTGQRNTSTVITATPDENEDDEEDECETGEAMPVPQVKVGPDGHLVLDEQSLVIEHTGAKKSRQALARTEALVDENSNGSGFYKKRRKTRDWPKWETLKFYKALNTVGTDFLLMQTLFPQRTRHEIKMKFKKEEKTNRRFVEKALIYYQEFDIDSLKEDLATFDETENQQTELVKSEKLAARQIRGPQRKKNKSRRMAALSIAESNEELEEPEASVKVAQLETQSSHGDTTITTTATTTTTTAATTTTTLTAATTTATTAATTTTTTMKAEKKRCKKRRQPTKIADSLISESTGSSEESASDTEIYQIKPTRSGRKPKVRKLQAPTINTLDNLFFDVDQENEKSTSPDFTITDKRQDRLSLNYTDADDDDDDNDDEDDANEIEDDYEDEEEVTIDETLHSRNNANAQRLQCIENSMSDISNVEPGSLIIIARESTDEPGEKVLQVYMVSSEIDETSTSGNGTRQNMTPVILTPELLNTVTAGITKVTPINVNTD